MTHATRERLILAAERLFAERGIGGVSLREIGTAAGQRNNSAAQYHFDTKDGLIEAIFEFRMAPINARRMALIEQIEREQRTRDPRALVEALVHPLSDAINSDSYYARFFAQVWLPTGEAGITQLQTRLLTFNLEGQQGLQRISTWVDEYLSELSPPLRVRRRMLIWRFMVLALAEYEQELQHGLPTIPGPVQMAQIADMMVAMLTIPSPAATTRERPARG